MATKKQLKNGDVLKDGTIYNRKNDLKRDAYYQLIQRGLNKKNDDILDKIVDVLIFKRANCIKKDQNLQADIITLAINAFTLRLEKIEAQKKEAASDLLDKMLVERISEIWHNLETAFKSLKKSA